MLVYIIIAGIFFLLIFLTIKLSKRHFGLNKIGNSKNHSDNSVSTTYITPHHSSSGTDSYSGEGSFGGGGASGSWSDSGGDGGSDGGGGGD